MYTELDKEWFNYCEALKISPYDKTIKNSKYYQKGFEEWKKLQKEFRYYNYMASNS